MKVANELLGVFERRDGLGQVDDDVVVVVHHLAAVRPQAPVNPAVGVAGGVAERKAGRLAGLLEALAQLEIPGGVVGNSSKPAARMALMR